MSGFLINPYAFKAYDLDALDYIERVETADGQALETPIKDLINDLFVGCKADGILGALKASCILAAARTLAGALTPLLSSMPAPTNVGFVAGDYNRKTGLLGDGASKYLNSNRNNNADPQDSQHMSVWATTAATSTSTTFPIYMGVGPLAAGVTYIGRLNSNGPLYIRSRSSDYVEVNPGSAVGLLGVSRGSSAYFTTRVAGSSANHVIASEAPFNQNVIVFAANTDPGRPSNGRLSFYSIGESLDLTLLDARVSTFMSGLAALTL